jgi:hypothetical protein
LTNNHKAMNEETKQIVEQAIAPLKTEIAELKVQLAPLLAMIPNPANVPPNIKAIKKVLEQIPKDVLTELKVTDVAFDPKQPWMRMKRSDGTTVSVKMAGETFRVRLRDQGDQLLKEISVPFNGLVNALNSLA